ncbi:MAG: ABC transporter ATP-binding protein [Bifidobacteriaceae bacterium]|nr:ABC transporter ATP-binding protein [Bifidobacteriaceae bacterium]
MTAVIDARGLTRIYGSGESQVAALAGFDLTVEPGEFVAVMGASGSGKSTAMNILGCLDVPDDGTYLLDGKNVGRMGARQLARVRGRTIGFVFQSFNLVSRMSALRNVELPMLYAGVSRREARRRATAALDMVGLSHRATHRPSELSGGQQQRVAVARSLVNTPTLLLADEPTGNLDSASAEQVLEVLEAINRAGRTIVLITHDHDVASHAGRIAHMRDGRIVAVDTRVPAAAGAAVASGGTA